MAELLQILDTSTGNIIAKNTVAGVMSYQGLNIVPAAVSANNQSVNAAPSATNLTAVNAKSITSIASNIVLNAIIPIANGSGITLTGLNFTQGAISNVADSEAITVKMIVATGAAGAVLETGVYTWTFADITMPAQAANGANNAFTGIKITGGTQAGGASAYQRGIDITMAASGNTALQVNLGLTMLSAGASPPNPDSNLHVWNSTAGNVTADSSSLATFEQGGTGGTAITLLCPNNGYSRIYFGMPSGNSRGSISYYGSSYGTSARTDGFLFIIAGAYFAFLDNLGNLILGAASVVYAGATAQGNLVLSNTSVAPTASVDLCHLYCRDLGGVGGQACLNVYQEYAPYAGVGIASTTKIPVVWNGTALYLLATTVA